LVFVSRSVERAGLLISSTQFRASAVAGNFRGIHFMHPIARASTVTGTVRGIHFMHPIARASAVTGTVRGIHFMHLIYLQRFCSHLKLRD